MPHSAEASLSEQLRASLAPGETGLAALFLGQDRRVAQGIGQGLEGDVLTPTSKLPLGPAQELLTATVLAVLAAKDYLSMGSRVRSLLSPMVRLPADVSDQELTLCHLATHTSGLPSCAELGLRASDCADPEVLYQALAGIKLEHDAGMTYRWSDLGYVLLQHALAMAMHRDFAALQRDFVLGPLGCSEVSGGTASVEDLGLLLALNLQGFKWRCLGFQRQEEARKMQDAALSYGRRGEAVATGWHLARHLTLGTVLISPGPDSGPASTVLVMAPALRAGLILAAPVASESLRDRALALLQRAATPVLPRATVLAPATSRPTGPVLG